MSKAKQWVFTLNNYTPEDEQHLDHLGERDGTIYLVYGRETGESGTPHLQGFIQLETRRSLKWMRDNVSERGHYQVCRGTPKQASDYCKKDGSFTEIGNLRVGSGRRTDLEEVVQAIRDGKTKRELAEEHPTAVLRYGRNIDTLRICQKPPTRVGPPLIQVFWGDTGLGKTRRVHEECPPEELWIHPGEKWFDGYDGHKYVLFDDFDGGWFKLGYLLKILDRYTFQVPIKGGHVWWYPENIYLTSNIDPREWYQGANQKQQDALIRRLHEFGQITHFNKPI